MSNRACSAYLVLLVALPMCGCPPVSENPEILLGEWAFTVAPNTAGLILRADGTAEIVLIGGAYNGQFQGMVDGWTQDGEMFAMHQSVPGGLDYDWGGTVYHPTYMEGTYQDSNGGSGIWTASFVQHRP